MTGDEQNLPNTSQVDMTEPSNLESEGSVMHGAEAVHNTEEAMSSSGQVSPHDAGPEDQPSNDDEIVSEASEDAGMSAAEQQAVIQQLEQEIAAIKAQVDERNGLYVRLQADFDNFRKRTQKEKEDLETQVKCSTIVELLPVIDNFDRARSQLKPQTEEGNNIHKSYQGVYKQLVDCLKRIGVSPMRSEGKDFDPNLHEAVIREPTDQHAEGVVIEELVRGYLLGDKVLRHAMVKVATVPEDGANEES